jgi:hypothetical protein
MSMSSAYSSTDCNNNNGYGYLSSNMPYQTSPRKFSQAPSQTSQPRWDGGALPSKESNWQDLRYVLVASERNNTKIQVHPGAQGEKGREGDAHMATSMEGVNFDYKPADFDHQYTPHNPTGGQGTYTIPPQPDYYNSSQTPLYTDNGMNPQCYGNQYYNPPPTSQYTSYTGYPTTQSNFGSHAQMPQYVGDYQSQFDPPTFFPSMYTAPGYAQNAGNHPRINTPTQSNFQNRPHTYGLDTGNPSLFGVPGNDFQNPQTAPQPPPPLSGTYADNRPNFSPSPQNNFQSHPQRSEYNYAMDSGNSSYRYVPSQHQSYCYQGYSQTPQTFNQPRNSRYNPQEERYNQRYTPHFSDSGPNPHTFNRPHTRRYDPPERFSSFKNVVP